MSNWSDPSWKMRVGVNHAPAYQVSGRPFASGGIDALPDQAVVNFPYVTRWVQVINSTSASTKSFSKSLHLLSSLGANFPFFTKPWSHPQISS